jgi:hypothetical protein
MVAPFISEHGSALIVPHGCFPSVPAHSAAMVSGHAIEFGRPYHEVVDRLRLTSRAVRVRLVGFAELTIDDVARELGVQTVEAQLAKLREYSEMIRILDENDAAPVASLAHFAAEVCGPGNRAAIIWLLRHGIARKAYSRSKRCGGRRGVNLSSSALEIVRMTSHGCGTSMSPSSFRTNKPTWPRGW